MGMHFFEVLPLTCGGDVRIWNNFSHYGTNLLALVSTSSRRSTRQEDGYTLFLLLTLILFPFAIFAAFFVAAVCDYALGGGPAATTTGQNEPNTAAFGLTSAANHS